MKLLTNLMALTCIGSISYFNEVCAQGSVPETYPDTTEIVIDTTEIIEYPEELQEAELTFEENLDSMLHLYYVQNGLKIEEGTDYAETDSTIPSFPDSVIIQRLQSILSVVELSYNRVVRNYIDMYTKKKRKNVEVMLGLAEHYFPIFDDIFDYYDVPNEMKYMSIIESALNPRAYSRARAVGLWQFMYGTGRIYGLEINSLVDERRDPIKSTHAAAKFAKDLYEIYGDWILVIAAYNCGPGNVNKAIRRAGGKRNYWDIYYYLPRETRGHVPAFIAATYTMNFYKEHNLRPATIELPVVTDTIWVKEEVHLEQISKVIDIPVKQLQDLNPQYRYDILPAKTKEYALRLPMEKVNGFLELEDSIYAYNDSVYFNEEKIITSPTASSKYYAPVLPGDDYVKLTYTVKSGDNLGYISEWYKVRISDIRYWNNIRRNLIRSGQKLTIYKHKNAASKYKDIDKLSFAEKQARIGKSVPNQQPSQPKVEESGDFIYYTVKSGDTLWDIAKMYPGVTDTDIMRWNNISNAGKIKPGQRLKVKPKTN